jgi:hypothetical protein
LAGHFRLFRGCHEYRPAIESGCLGAALACGPHHGLENDPPAPFSPGRPMEQKLRHFRFVSVYLVPRAWWSSRQHRGKSFPCRPSSLKLVTVRSHPWRESPEWTLG